MKKIVCAATLMLAAAAFSVQAAQAGGLSGQKDRRVGVASLVVGAASTGAYFAIRNKGSRHPPSGDTFKRPTRLAAWGLSTVGCMSASPILAGIVAQRELTRREVHVMMASCVLPIVGGWLMNRYFDRHPDRDSVPVMKVAKRVKK